MPELNLKKNKPDFIWLSYSNRLSNSSELTLLVSVLLLFKIVSKSWNAFCNALSNNFWPKDSFAKVGIW